MAANKLDSKSQANEVPSVSPHYHGTTPPKITPTIAAYIEPNVMLGPSELARQIMARFNISISAVAISKWIRRRSQEQGDEIRSTVRAALSTSLPDTLGKLDECERLLYLWITDPVEYANAHDKPGRMKLMAELRQYIDVKLKYSAGASPGEVLGEIVLRVRPANGPEESLEVEAEGVASGRT